MLWGEGHDTRGMRGFFRAPLAAVAVLLLLAFATGILQGDTSLARKAPNLNPYASLLFLPFALLPPRLALRVTTRRVLKVAGSAQRGAERHRHMATSRR
jgi:hypothetical protein